MRVIDLLGGTELMTRSECLEFLRRRNIGRLATVTAGQPDIVPVNYFVDGGDVVIASNLGHKLLAASEALVAFEVDSIDEERRRASSVVVHGSATAEAPSAAASAAVAWSGPKDFLIRIVPTAITGRHITAS